MGDSVHHHDLNPLDYIPDGQWNFAAITADRDGDALLYLGMPDGKLAFITERLEDFGDINNMDWYLGQDGTGDVVPCTEDGTGDAGHGQGCKVCFGQARC